MKDLKTLEKNTKNRFNYIVWLRATLFILGVGIFFYSTGWCDYRASRMVIVLIINPLIMVYGWIIAGRRKITKAGVNPAEDYQKAVKITALHSILLVLAIISIVLEVRVLTAWKVVYVQTHNVLGNLQVTTTHILIGFVMMGILVILISLYKYRYSAVEYYSVVCHGVGFICTLLNYINMIRGVEQMSHRPQILLRYEWVYVESLILAGAFLVYCSLDKKNQTKKAV